MAKKTKVDALGTSLELSGVGDYFIRQDGTVNARPQGKNSLTGTNISYGALDIPLANQSPETIAAKEAFIAAIEADYAAYHALVESGKAVNSSDPARRVL